MLTDIYQKTLQQQLELIGSNCTRFSQQLKRFSKVSKPEEFISLQKECITENLSASIEYFQSLYALSVQNFEELSKNASNTAKASEKNNNRPL